MTDGFPAPYVVSDRSPKQVVDVVLSPYCTGILQSFISYGMNPSQVVEWIAREYANTMTPRPEPKKVKRQPKFKKQQQAPPSKPTFVHNRDNGPVTKKTQIKPKRG